MSFFNTEKDTYKICMLNFGLLLLTAIVFATIDYWFIYHGDYKTDPLISTRSFMMPFLILTIFCIIFNGCYAFRKAMQSYKGFFYTMVGVILPLVAFSFWVYLSIDSRSRSYMLSKLAQKEVFYCKMYSKGHGKSGINLYYYATDNSICKNLIQDAPHYRKDFDKAIDIQTQLNTKEK